MDFGFVPVAAVAVICYLIGLGLKASKLRDEWIPVILGLCGAILGVFGMRMIPDYPAQDIITAIAIGIVSGLAATGTHQIYKQLKNS